MIILLSVNKFIYKPKLIYSASVLKIVTVHPYVTVRQFKSHNTNLVVRAKIQLPRCALRTAAQSFS